MERRAESYFWLKRLHWLLLESLTPIRLSVLIKEPNPNLVASTKSLFLAANATTEPINYNPG